MADFRAIAVVLSLFGLMMSLAITVGDCGGLFDVGAITGATGLFGFAPAGMFTAAGGTVICERDKANEININDVRMAAQTGEGFVTKDTSVTNTIPLFGPFIAFLGFVLAILNNTLFSYLIVARAINATWIGELLVGWLIAAIMVIGYGEWLGQALGFWGRR